MKISIGIDPGISGAVAAINAHTLELLEVSDTPTVTIAGKKLYDIGEMVAIIRHVSLMGDVVVILEQAQAMPGQGVTSTFSIGRSFGLWEGILEHSTCRIGRYGLLCGQSGYSLAYQERARRAPFNSP
jgi:crossover junction endodeoxyribonuclease RuvC